MRTVLLEQPRMVNANKHHQDQPDVEGAVGGDVDSVFCLPFVDAEVFRYGLLAGASHEAARLGFSEL